MERNHINQLQEEENQWFQHSRIARDEVHRLTKRARQLLSQADKYTSTIGTTLETLHDESLELKLLYLTEIKASTTYITIVLADWHAFKARLITSALAMLKMLASDGPPTGTST